MAMTRTIPKRRNWYPVPPTPILIKIRDDLSCPAMVIEPSFLTSLPAEIRNEIYGWLFKRNDPIIYIGHGGACELDFVRSISDDDEETLQYTEAELVVLSQPSHDIGPASAMLRTCLQIYREAVGILYSANVFHISSSLTHHNTDMDQFTIAEKFLDGLGSQLYLIKYITIDISPLCHPDCEVDLSAQQRIDILPLLRLKWFYPSVDIRLIHTGRRIDPRVHWWDEDSTRIISAQVLDDLAKAIGMEDRFSLKTFARFERLIENVLMSRELDFGSITYGSTCHQMYSNPDRGIVIPFTIVHTLAGH